MKLSSLFRRKTPWSSTIRCNAPIPAEKRSGIALVAVMKDEELNILEWLRFHSIAGVKDFFLYDDGSKDRTIELANAFPFANVTIVPWRLKASLISPNVTFSRQAMAYAHAIENFGQDFRWMGFIDIDEFLFPTAANSLENALGPLDEFQNISVPWTMFGPNGHKHRPTGSSVFNFTTRAAERTGPLLNFKCIVDPCNVENARVHSFTTHKMGKMSANDQGRCVSNRRRRDPAFISSDALQLNHYYTRSYDEMNAKLNKGAISGSPKEQRKKKVLEKLEIIEQTKVDDVAALNFLKRAGIENENAFLVHRPETTSKQGLD